MDLLLRKFGRYGRSPKSPLRPPQDVPQTARNSIAFSISRCTPKSLGWSWKCPQRSLTPGSFPRIAQGSPKHARRGGSPKSHKCPPGESKGRKAAVPPESTDKCLRVYPTLHLPQSIILNDENRLNSFPRPRSVSLLDSDPQASLGTISATQNMERCDCVICLNV